jgi:hypothetical protein
MQDVSFVLAHELVIQREERQGRAHSGGDDRGGHLWPLSMMAASSRAPFLGCYGAFAWHRGRWDGRRHDRGLILKLNYTAREGGSNLQKAAKNAMN